MPLTKSQRLILDAIIFLSRRGDTPTVREIGVLVGRRSPATVQKHLTALEAAGVIEMTGKSRGIRPIKGTGIPIVGRIAAGEPLETPDMYAENAVDDDSLRLFGFEELPIDPGVFLSGTVPGDVVALRVAGDSMVDAGILDGDMVIIRRQPAVEEGQIAAVLVDGAGTLKRWHVQTAEASPRERSRAESVRLTPENRRFEPIEIRQGDHQDVRVFGRYIGLIRSGTSL